MARYSVSKAVARAGAAGSSKNYKGARPWGFYSVLIAIAILGTVGIFYSRSEMVARDAAASTSSTAKPAAQPAVGTTWRVALGFYVCGKFLPNLAASPNASTVGINTTGNGLITVAPKNKTEAGSKATFGYFVKNYPGLVVNSKLLTVPSQGSFKAGSTCPGSTVSSQITIRIFSSALDRTGSDFRGNINSLKFADGELITVAYGPKSQSIPQPPSKSQLIQATPPTSTTTAAGSTPTIPLGSTPATTPTT